MSGGDGSPRSPRLLTRVGGVGRGGASADSLLPPPPPPAPTSGWYGPMRRRQRGASLRPGAEPGEAGVGDRVSVCPSPAPLSLFSPFLSLPLQRHRSPPSAEPHSPAPAAHPHALRPREYPARNNGHPAPLFLFFLFFFSPGLFVFGFVFFFLLTAKHHKKVKLFLLAWCSLGVRDLGCLG